jgi:MSHA biogenesis protein MshP
MPRSGGFGLILALFLLVSLAAIGAYLLTVSTAQVAAVAQDVMAANAYQAARAGIDWSAYQILRNPSGSFATGCQGGAASQTLTLSGNLGGFYAQVSCQSPGAEIEAGATVRGYQITVTACNQNPCGASVGPTYVERQLQLTLTD